MYFKQLAQASCCRAMAVSVSKENRYCAYEMCTTAAAANAQPFVASQKLDGVMAWQMLTGSGSSGCRHLLQKKL
jgi:hypothetical protein